MLEREGALLVGDLVETDAGRKAGFNLGEGHDGAVCKEHGRESCWRLKGSCSRGLPQPRALPSLASLGENAMASWKVNYRVIVVSGE